MRSLLTQGFIAAWVLCCLGCSDKKKAAPAPVALGAAPGVTSAAKPTPSASTGDPASPSAGALQWPSKQPALGLLLAYAQFEVADGKVTAKPGPARVEILRPKSGAWEVEAFEDSESNVFHKALAYEPRPQATPGPAAVLTLGAMPAALKLWRRGPDGFRAEVLWQAEFGGRFHRMRDAEVADFNGDGRADLAVGTHDQGVVAIVSPKAVSPKAKQGYDVRRIDDKKDTFIHEIEIGDLNGDKVLEVYATPSEPNRLKGGAQHGEVVRYLPSQKGAAARTVVADLGSRHAKEIYVGDVDGDGRDELYVAVEALTKKGEQGVEIVEPVEIRRYDHDTPADKGTVVATIPDRFARFITVGDVEGDGQKEMVVAAFRSGVWLLRPAQKAKQPWQRTNIDSASSGFEHAALFADLDRDGRDELYVAADEQGELRQYVWQDGQPKRQTIHRRALPGARMTWNIMPVPLKAAPASPP